MVSLIDIYLLLNGAPGILQMTSMRKPDKIVIVSQYYAPDHSTTATYMTAIAKGLRTDFEVLVISGTALLAARSASSFADGCAVQSKPISRLDEGSSRFPSA